MCQYLVWSSAATIWTIDAGSCKIRLAHYILFAGSSQTHHRASVVAPPLSNIDSRKMSPRTAVAMFLAVALVALVTLAPPAAAVLEGECWSVTIKRNTARNLCLHCCCSCRLLASCKSLFHP